MGCFGELGCLGRWAGGQVGRRESLALSKPQPLTGEQASEGSCSQTTPCSKEICKFSPTPHSTTGWVREGGEELDV